MKVADVKEVRSGFESPAFPDCAVLENLPRSQIPSGHLDVFQMIKFKLLRTITHNTPMPRIRTDVDRSKPRCLQLEKLAISSSKCFVRNSIIRPPYTRKQIREQEGGKYDGTHTRIQRNGGARYHRDPRFREALFSEALNVYLAGGGAEGKAMLRDLVNATIGFKELSVTPLVPSESLHRKLSPRGNLSAEAFFGIVPTLQKKARVKLRITAEAVKDGSLVSFVPHCSTSQVLP